MKNKKVQTRILFFLTNMIKIGTFIVTFAFICRPICKL